MSLSNSSYDSQLPSCISITVTIVVIFPKPFGTFLCAQLFFCSTIRAREISDFRKRAKKIWECLYNRFFMIHKDLTKKLFSSLTVS